MSQKNYTLREDISSLFKRSHVYGKAGDVVVIVAEHGNVLIVEGINNDRFPVKPEQLNDEQKKGQESMTQEATVKIPSAVKKQKKLAKSKAPANNSNTLF